MLVAEVGKFVLGVCDMCFCDQQVWYLYCSYVRLQDANVIVCVIGQHSVTIATMLIVLLLL